MRLHFTKILVSLRRLFCLNILIRRSFFGPKRHVPSQTRLSYTHGVFRLMLMVSFFLFLFAFPLYSRVLKENINKYGSCRTDSPTEAEHHLIDIFRLHVRFRPSYCSQGSRRPEPFTSTQYVINYAAKSRLNGCFSDARLPCQLGQTLFRDVSDPRSMEID